MFVLNIQLAAGKVSMCQLAHFLYPAIQNTTYRVSWYIIPTEVSVSEDNLPPFVPFFIASLILGILGIVGLFLLIDFTVPTLGPRWLFFFLVTCTVSGVALPIAYFFHWRFPSKTVRPGVIIREAIFGAVFFDLLAWFQLGRVLSLPLGLAVAAGLALIEFALRLAERSRFAPKESQHE